MKELSIEEKAKAYDEAKARMSRAFNSNRCTIGFMNEIFPELKERDNERIRKEIVDFINRVYERQALIITDEEKDNWIAWLEKQDETFTKKDVDDAYLKGISDAKNELEKQGENKKENNFDVLPGLYKCVHRMFDGTPDGRLLFEVDNVYKCLSKHDRAEFEVSYGHSVYLEDPVVHKHFIPFEKQGEEKTTDNVEQKFKVGDWITIK